MGYYVLAQGDGVPQNRLIRANDSYRVESAGSQAMAMRPLRPLGRLNAKSSCCVVRKPEMVGGRSGVFVVAGTLPGKV